MMENCDKIKCVNYNTDNYRSCMIPLTSTRDKCLAANNSLYEVEKQGDLEPEELTSCDRTDCFNYSEPRGLHCKHENNVSESCLTHKWTMYVPVQLRDPQKQSRGAVLQEAHKIINGARLDAYGKPEDSFETIASYWSEWCTTKLKEPLTAKDVAMMMVLLKIARESSQHKRDNLVDAAGYLGLLGSIEEEGL